MYILLKFSHNMFTPGTRLYTEMIRCRIFSNKSAVTATKTLMYDKFIMGVHLTTCKHNDNIT